MSTATRIFTDRSLEPGEYIELVVAVHGHVIAEDTASVQAALDAYHLVAHARDELGVLVGTVCAFSGGVFATFVGELVVHPGAPRRGVGGRLLDTVERAWPGVPVFALGFRDARRFFLGQGYTLPAPPMEIFARLNARAGDLCSA